MMATLTPRLFSKDATTDLDEEQLLKLFWNRAELKKELGALEAEMSGLEEQARQKDALMLRVQQRLNQLEAMLADPDSADIAVTYYHLRSVWHHCNQLLDSLASELRRSHRDKAYQDFIACQEEARNASVAPLDQEAAGITMECDALAERIRALRIQRQSHGGIFGAFKRRRVTTELNLQREQRKQLNQTLADLVRQKRERLEHPVAEFEGLDLMSKRRINLLVLAYAQELVLLLLDADIAQLSRGAALSELSDMSYGGNRACRDIRRSAAERMKALACDAGLRSRITRRSRYLATVVEYRNEQDAVPMAASLSGLSLLDEAGSAYNEISLNVLADEYWDLFGVLLG
jgi:hypothetical protein